MAEPPWRTVEAGLIVTVRLTPRGGRDAIDGVEAMSDGRMALKARVRAVAEDGKANAALVALLAGVLRIPKSDVVVSAGHTARVKTLALSGDPSVLAAALRRVLPGD